MYSTSCAPRNKCRCYTTDSSPGPACLREAGVPVGSSCFTVIRLRFRLSDPQMNLYSLSQVHWENVVKRKHVSRPCRGASIAWQIDIFNHFDKIYCESGGSAFVNLLNACHFFEHPLCICKSQWYFKSPEVTIHIRPFGASHTAPWMSSV